MESNMTDRSQSIPNIGPVSRRWLTAVGIHSLADLRRAGAVASFLLVRQSGVRATHNLLWALEAARLGVDWRQLSDARKEQLLGELRTADGGGDL
jgi:DNA transformation protein